MSVIPNLISLNVLLVEDNPGDVKLVENLFARITDLRVNLRKASTLADAENVLNEGPLHAILLDLGLPDSRGTSSVKRMVKAAGDRPVIVLTGLVNDHSVAKALEFGAQDYIAKDLLTPGLLRKTLLYAIEHRKMLNHLIKDQEDLRCLSSMKEEFLSVVSHELRTPLTSILGYLDILRKECEGILSVRQKEYLATIAQNADRLLFQVNALLDTSHFDRHFQKAQFEFLHSREQVANVLKTVTLDPASRKGDLAIDPGAPEGDLIVSADAKMLAQVLINLVANSMRYSPPDEAILVGFRAETREGNEGVLFWVKDRGKGIPDDLKLRIFDKFYQIEKFATSNIGGLGLGLSVVKSIMDLHGGRVWVEDNAEKGSMFCVFFPNRKIVAAVA